MLKVMVLLISLGFSSSACAEEPLNTSQWDSTFRDKEGTLNVQCIIKFNETGGTYESAMGDPIGTFRNTSFKWEITGVGIIRGEWEAFGRTGTFQFVVPGNEKTFSGSWKDSMGGSGVWKGNRINAPFITGLPEPRMGAQNDSELITRHAAATLRVIASLSGGANCTTQLEHVETQFMDNEGSYWLSFSQARNGDKKTQTLRIPSAQSPYDAAVGVTKFLKNGPCSINESPEKEPAKLVSTAIQKSVSDFRQFGNAIQQEGGAIRGQLAAPGILVSKDEVILSAPMNLDLQKRLISQIQQGIPEVRKENGTPDEQPREMKWGSDDILSLTLFSRASRPNGNNLNAAVRVGAKITFINRVMNLLNAWVETSSTSEGEKIRMKGEMKAMTQQGYKVLATINEESDTSFERPEQIFLDNVVLADYPVVCIPTPIGPACIEGRLVGSVGAKPYGVKGDGNDLTNFQAYYRPYGRIDLEVFGGLEYAIAHAGVRGQVSVVDGTLAALVGKLNPDSPREYCSRAEVDKMTFLDGRILLDIQAQLLPDDLTSDLQDKLGEACNDLKDQSAPIIDLVRQAKEGLNQLGDALNTAQQVADQVRQVGQVLADPIGAVSSSVGQGLSAVASKVPLVNFKDASTLPFLNSVNQIDQMDCDDTVKKLADSQKIRYVKEIYHWKGVETQAHHKWYEACSRFGE